MKKLKKAEKAGKNAKKSKGAKKGGKKGKKGKKSKEPKKPPIVVPEEPSDVVKPKHILEGHKSWVLDMKIYDDYLYSASDDRSIIVWDLERSIFTNF